MLDINQSPVVNYFIEKHVPGTFDACDALAVKDSFYTLSPSARAASLCAVWRIKLSNTTGLSFQFIAMNQIKDKCDATVRTSFR